MTDSGSTAWTQASTALVILMALPGSALYYSGMVGSLNVLATLRQMLLLASMISMMWLFFSYSLAWAPVSSNEYGNADGNPTQSNSVLGDSSRFWLVGLTVTSVNDANTYVPETVWIIFQLSIAILTAVFAAGFFCNRLKLTSMLAFFFCWHICVYCPIAHWVWHPNGFLYKSGVLDWAGSNVIFMVAGSTARALIYIMGDQYYKVIFFVNAIDFNFFFVRFL